MPSPATPSPVTRIKRFLPLRTHPQPQSQPVGRAVLRDLYTSGLVSIFRRHSILRIWEPLRESPRHPQSDSSAG